MDNLLTLLDWSQNSINELADVPLIMKNVVIKKLGCNLAVPGVY
jgi:hypothetical protein